MNQPKRIFIVGHMGAGKALVGEALAKKLGWQFIDANPSLERYIGRNLKPKGSSINLTYVKLILDPFITNLKSYTR